MATKFNCHDQGEIASLLPLVRQQLALYPSKQYSHRLVLVVDRDGDTVRLYSLPAMGLALGYYLLTLIVFYQGQCWMTILQTALNDTEDFSGKIWRVIPAQLKPKESPLDDLFSGLSL